MAMESAAPTALRDPSAAPDFVEFRGIGDLLAWFGLLPAPRHPAGRGDRAARAEALLRRLGPWRRHRGFRVPLQVLEDVLEEVRREF
jgi:hypothetical protein